MILPKKYLSYSAIQQWNESREQFRKKYYLCIWPAETRFTLYGHEIEKEIYAGLHPHIPCFGGQHKLETEIENIPIVGYLDSFDKNKNRFIDFKSSKNKWTKSQVQRLDQLPFYSMLVKKIYGSVDPFCQLVWLETRLVKQSGLLQQEEKLELTGKFEIFEREIEPFEHVRMVKWIVKSAEAISKDYQLWQEKRGKITEQSIVPASPVITKGRTGTLLTSYLKQ